MWLESEVADYEVLKKKAANVAQEMPQFVKDALRKLD
jgi:hypothetical protein